jgi:hypothetical protein
MHCSIFLYISLFLESGISIAGRISEARSPYALLHVFLCMLPESGTNVSGPISKVPTPYAPLHIPFHIESLESEVIISVPIARLP